MPVCLVKPNKPVTKRAKITALRFGVFQDLPIDPRHRRKERGAGLSNKPGPQGRILFTCIDDGGGAVGPGVSEPCSQRIGPVEGTGVHYTIFGLNVVPALIHGPPPEG